MHKHIKCSRRERFVWRHDHIIFFPFVFLVLLSCINSNINKSNTHTHTQTLLSTNFLHLHLYHSNTYLFCSKSFSQFNTAVFKHWLACKWANGKYTQFVILVLHISRNERFARNGFALLSTHSGFKYNTALFRFCCSRQCCICNCNLQLPEGYSTINETN